MLSLFLLQSCGSDPTTDEELEKLAFSAALPILSVEQYKKDNGKYPKTIKDLSPKYIEVKEFNYKGWYYFTDPEDQSSYILSHKILRESSLSYYSESGKWFYNKGNGKKIEKKFKSYNQ